MKSGSDGIRPVKPSGAGGVNVAAWLRPTRSASTSAARGLAAERSGSTMLTTKAWLLVLTYKRPVSGSNAPPPQLAPPMMPGRTIVPRADGGV